MVSPELPVWAVERAGSAFAKRAAGAEAWEVEEGVAFSAVVVAVAAAVAVDVAAVVAAAAAAAVAVQQEVAGEAAAHVPPPAPARPPWPPGECHNRTYHRC